MRNIKECLRLKLEAGLSHEKIARALQLSKGVVSKYITAARVAGLDWPALATMDEAVLAAALFPPVSPGKTRGERVLPDVLNIHRELHRKGVTLQLLWEEYLAAHPGQPTYRYTQFVEHYRRYAQTCQLRPNHRLQRLTQPRHLHIEQLASLEGGSGRALHTGEVARVALEDFSNRPFDHLGAVLAMRPHVTGQKRTD
jgi:hypothetical protein